MDQLSLDKACNSSLLQFFMYHFIVIIKWKCHACYHNVLSHLSSTKSSIYVHPIDKLHTQYINTLLLHLLWVWSGWGVTIMIMNRGKQYQKPTESPRNYCLYPLRGQISMWVCIHMTVIHSRKCWNTLYMYEVDLIWVWSGVGVVIITYSTIQWETKRIPYYHFSLSIRLGLHPYDHQPQYKVLKHIIHVWSRPDMCMKWVRCLNRILTHATSEKRRESPLPPVSLRLWDPLYIRLGLHPYDHQPQYKVLQHYIYVWQQSAMSMKWVRCSYHSL